MLARDELDRRKAALSLLQRKALEQRILGGEHRSNSSIPFASRSSAIPLSFAQERIWLHEQLVPGSLVYNRPANIRLIGPLQINLLQQALQAVLSRHQSIWTCVGSADAEPVLKTQTQTELAVPLTNLAAELDAVAQASQIAADEAARPLSLGMSPLVRIRLLRTAAEDHLLLLTFHHFAFDAWSQAVLLRELAAFYGALAVGDKSPGADLPIQYTDFSAWDRSKTRVDALAVGRSFWQRELADPPALQLPTDYPRPANLSEAAAHVEFVLPKHLVTGIRQLAQREATTFFALVLAAFQTLLYRYTGQHDIVVGCPVAGRNRIESEELIGVFINTLPLRSRLSDDDTFRQLLHRVSQTVVAGLTHQDVPLQFIVQDVLTDRDVSGSPLFQAMFIHERLPMLPRTSAGVTFEPEDRPAPATMVDLSLEVTESNTSVTGRWTYRRELWESGTIARMVGHFVTLLEAIAVDADHRISKLPLLTKSERHQLLVEWNNTEVAYPRDKCIHELFEEQVERTPAAVAVVFEDQKLTYRELNVRANQLAHYLRSRGVGPEALVGLCLERSLELVVGILGILKAGGTYMPLDADYPRKRLQFMLCDSAAKYLVTQMPQLCRLPVIDCTVICLDAEAQNLQDIATSNPSVDIGGDHLAYVMYTSGSTGQPKGVQISHSAVVNLLSAIASQSVVVSDDRMLSVTTPTFDISVMELLLPLTVGASLEVLPADFASDAVRLSNHLTMSAATAMVATPVTWSMLIQSGWNGGRHLKVLCGGEALLDGLAEELYSRCGELWNLYGPTETTIFSTAVRAANGRLHGSVGRPIANTTVYVLDTQRQPVPIGVPGELYIGGAGLARGYLNQPALTSEKFVASPFDYSPGSRLYRTGDLCRWRADGNLEFLGRLDDQVKLRGFRIELGEIEFVLNEHPDIVQNVVILREDRPGDKRLVAYCVSATDAQLDVNQLRSHLRSRLPDYMLPAVFVGLDKLPLTSSGKTDRRRLPAPNDSRPSLETGYVDPRSPIEQQLASIWSEVLGIETIGIRDNFFALGGHSLLATRVRVRIASALQVELPLRNLFETPTIAELSHAIETLRSGGRSACVTTLTRVDREQQERLTLSLAQQRLWFLDQMEGELTAYNMPFGLRLRGSLDVESLRRALEGVVRRHEPLRTNFALIDGEPVQVIGTIERFELPLEDLSGLEPQLQETEILRRCRLEAEKPFDLSRDLMLRACLLHLADDEHVLLLTMHHIASDGWSMRVLWRELALLYDAYCRGTDLTQPDLPVRYTDYAIWQRSQLQGQRMEQLLQYWRKQLQVVSALELPTDRPRPTLPTYCGARHSFELPEDVVSQLKSLSQTAGVTLHMTLLAAFQVLLSRYSGQDDITVGVPFAGRNHAALEELIGFFVNTLVIRTDLSEDPTFRELLGRVRQVSLEAYDHQDLPFEKLVEELKPERHLSRSPLFQVLFQLLNFSDEGLTLRELEVSRLPSGNQRVRFDLEMHLWQRGKTLSGSLVYSTDLFDGSTIERMVGHFVTLLQGVVADADKKISELPLLTELERHQLLMEWNDTAEKYPIEKCVHELFEEQVERTPDAVAVIFEDQQLTYRELNARANQLAHYLRSMGIGKETVVPLFLDRSMEIVIAILGVLKAGGAYLPMDVAYPKQRLAWMLEDCSASVVLTQQRLIEGLLPPFDTQVLCLDSQWDLVAAFSDLEPTSETTVENLAYIIYTSGSTGQPKGVMVTHANVARLFVATQQWFHFSSTDVWTVFHSYAFDFSVWEIWGALLYGGTAVMVPHWICRSPQAFHELLRREQVTVLNQTPSAFNQLIAADQQANAEGQMLSLRLVIFGGEALNLENLKPWFHRHGDRSPRMVNMYGITETTVHVTYCPILKADLARSYRGPIGRPIPDLQVYVLDQYGNPMPVGLPGELYVGGAGVSRGYLNRPKLTQERFVSHPFSDNPDSRLYRTGDVGRWLAGGCLEYLGRSDDQVQLRGYRIELGEVESALVQHAAVAQCVVMLRKDRPDDPRLVAYFVPQGNAALTAEDLRQHLSEKLPDYMLPAAFVALDALPLTSNGKVDRRRLPAPGDSRPELEAGYVAPRSLIEQLLETVWSNVLGIEEIGIHDNFFSLGGHSLLATQVNARISSALQLNLPLRRLFEAPTIAELAGVIESLRSGGQSYSIAALKRFDREKQVRLPLSFAQQRLWFLDQMEGELTAYNMPFGLRLRGSLDVESLRRALEGVVRRHEPLRTNFAMIDDEPTQVIGTIEQFELPREDLSGLEPQLQESEILRRCRLEAEKPFDLSRDLMLRACLLHLADDEHVLLLTMHHIASDGWSMRVLWRELALLYDAYCRGTDLTQPDLPVRYTDYAIWQRSQLQAQRMEQLLQYWRKQLQVVSALELPTDHPRPPVPTYRGGWFSFDVHEELIDSLQVLGQAAGVTLHMTLLAAFQVLLSRYSGQDDIVVGVPFAGRDHAELEELIGFFVNTLVIRTDLSEDPTFRELLGRVRQVSLEAYDHQDLPFEKLVEELKPERHLSRSPLFQVLFQLLNFSDEGLTLRELEVSRLPSGSQRVRFDLEMHLWQRGKTLSGSLVYSTDLFDGSTIERMAGHFVKLLQGVATNADQRISQLPLLTEPERHQLLVEWNDTAVKYPSETCIQELFEQQVERSPDAVAVIFEDQQLTYRELNVRANQLAHYLQSLGVGPDALVGLCLERSAELVIGILGILKAGGAYVPLDADYPPQRLDFMLRDAKVDFLVVQKRLIKRIPGSPGHIVCLDSESRKLLDMAQSNPFLNVMTNNLAYVMYTSGSTGTPKGVAMPHSALVNLINWHRNDPRLMRPARTLQFASCNFDVSFQEMLTTACCGGTLVMISEATRRDPNLLWKVIVESSVERLFVPYVALQQLAVVANGTAASTAAKLSDLISAGEALHLTPEIRHLIQGLGNGRLHNHYGPTESHVVTSSILGNNVATWPAEAPIGCPIANTKVYVLDARRQLVPIGVPGELYIGGAGLARGYLHRPELTAEKFVANSFDDAPGTRLYRTGDLCRWRADENLEFIGRLDDQVKLRGFRIELGEIESVLNEHPSVVQSVVILREDRTDDKRLVAYCVPAAETTLDISALRSHLRKKLPDYMLPAAIVSLDVLPLTSSGKIQRRGLPAPDDSRPTLETGYVAPRTPIEQQLASIWCDVLGIESLGIHDNFFALGGHSLLAVQLFAKIEKSFGRKLPLALLFQHGTVAHLATLLLESDSAPEFATVFPLQANGNGRPLFLMPSIGGEMLFLRALIEILGGRFPTFGIQPTLEPQYIEQFRDFRTTASYFVNALRRFQPHGPYALAGYSYGGMMAFEVASLLTDMGEKVDLLAVIDTGPGRRGLEKSFANRWSRLSRIATNLPYWLRDEWRGFSTNQLTTRIVRKLRRIRRVMVSRGRAQTELDDLFDANRILSQNQELMRTLFTAFRNYIPRRFEGKLTLIRANTRPLLSGCLNDLGWGRFVGELDVRPIKGNHETILHPPDVDEVARQLVELMEDLN